MQLRTRMLGHEQFESASESGHRVTIDMRSPDLRTHQNPTELLLSAVTACSAVDVVAILTKRKKTIHAFDVVTTGKRRTEHPRAFTDIHMEYTIHSSDITEEEALKAAGLAVEKYCSVAASLKSKITWSARIIETR
jgi:putative redox protein